MYFITVARVTVVRKKQVIQSVAIFNEIVHFVLWNSVYKPDKNYFTNFFFFVLVFTTIFPHVIIRIKWLRKFTANKQNIGIFKVLYRKTWAINTDCLHWINRHQIKIRNPKLTSLSVENLEVTTYKSICLFETNSPGNTTSRSKSQWNSKELTI